MEVNNNLLVFEKSLNNNIALANDENGNEVIVVGKGVGYNRKKGGYIEESTSNKIYKVENKDKFLKLTEDIPVNIIEVTEHIISQGTKMINKKINPSILLTLSDHIKFSVDRVKKNILIKSPLKWEIPHLYPTEYQVGKLAIQIVNKELGVELPVDEASLIALHFVNAQFENQDMQETIKITEIVNEIVDIVNYHYHIKLNENTINDSRFITHIYYLVIRLQNNKMVSGELDNSLYDIIKDKYIKSYKCALKIQKLLKDKYNWNICEDEIVYLVIHIERVILQYKHESIE